jgi:hypothetical protein
MADLFLTERQPPADLDDVLDREPAEPPYLFGVLGDGR